jgi:hypothetical protein
MGINYLEQRNTDSKKGVNAGETYTKVRKKPEEF